MSEMSGNDSRNGEVWLSFQINNKMNNKLIQTTKTEGKNNVK